MATLTIRDLDESLKLMLRVRAASRNRSMEEEARQILRAALLESPVQTNDLATRIRARFVGFGNVRLSVPPREPVRAPPNFEKELPSKRRAQTKPQTQTQTQTQKKRSA